MTRLGFSFLPNGFKAADREVRGSFLRQAQDRATLWSSSRHCEEQRDEAIQTSGSPHSLRSLARTVLAARLKKKSKAKAGFFPSTGSGQTRRKRLAQNDTSGIFFSTERLQSCRPQVRPPWDGALAQKTILKIYPVERLSQSKAARKKEFPLLVLKACLSPHG